MTVPAVAIAGMTHLGLNTAAALAERGCRTLGYDPDARLIERLGRGELPVVEQGLPELLEKNAANLTFTADGTRLTECDLVYVAPDVPTDEEGASDLAPVHELIELASQAMRDDAILVILSQVPPGFTRGLGQDPARLFCQVETLIFGRAVERALNPERFIVGCADPVKSLPPVLAEVLGKFGCPVLQIGYESAELAKIAINCCLVGSISVANTLAGLCERIGADWSEIAPALKLDARIGPHAYLAPGLGLAGGNLERDLATVCRYADALGTDAGVIRGFISNSHYRRDWVFRVLHETVIAKIDAPVIGILGLAYKPGTASTKNAASLRLIDQLASFSIRAHDVAVKAIESRHLRLTICSDPAEVWEGADALVVMAPWPDYGALVPAQIAEGMRGSVVVDPFGGFGRDACEAAGLEYHRLGQGSRHLDPSGVAC